MDKLSRAHEDYLEAIAMLGGSTECAVRPVDLAEKMDVSKASVTKAIGILREKGLVEQPRYGDITLTQAGNTYAQAVLERHQLLFRFLTQEVGIPEEQASKEACLMEHAISDESFEKWINYLKRLEG